MKLEFQISSYRVTLPPGGKALTADGVPLDRRSAQIVRGTDRGPHPRLPSGEAWWVELIGVDSTKYRIDGPRSDSSFSKAEEAMAALQGWVDAGMPEGVWFEGRAL